MGRRLPDEVIHRIRLRIGAGEEVAAIAGAVGVSKQTIYKLRLNLDIWGEPYAQPTVILGRPRALLSYQEQVIYDVMVLSFSANRRLYRGSSTSLKTVQLRI